jgi:hypothetical protein
LFEAAAKSQSKVERKIVKGKPGEEGAGLSKGAEGEDESEIKISKDLEGEDKTETENALYGEGGDKPEKEIADGQTDTTSGRVETPVTPLQQGGRATLQANVPEYDPPEPEEGEQRLETAWDLIAPSLASAAPTLVFLDIR